MNTVRCTFYLRIPAAKQGYHYETFDMPSYHGDGNLHTRNPPLVGDKLILVHPKSKASGSFRVVSREWGYNGYGSVNWPLGSPETQMPDMLRCVVDECDSIFLNEAD